jgi:localization factor PodJL
MGQYNLGILYGTGPPKTRDSVRAYAWLSLAETHGMIPANAARQAIAARMSAREIEEARQLAERWRRTAP